ncbi:ribosomal RNA large subunit methyltransferase E [Rhodomicrobium udaipurense JA643]|uniref:Ribosomal RNA large subunit methyltransferase E n=1 Tax=Rhodomicrobium udaipurense TaxID=1202716 RepID=A0A8I1GJ50_9HYPH|nr:RlmE family RNA methyltransferase [Rhodomicrobium udaipurense]KAI94972.1 ribosomal RNA large subunit methyltransferase E [Rhodomicrobium udaipurense JA643]MBJ7544910.1 RlmE family RNA methyltransferase [Rhodomicrobium udaipurense]
MTKREQNPDRSFKIKLKKTRGRTASQRQWLERQLNDPYVAAAKRDGYRSRAAYKLEEIAEKYGLLKPSDIVVDLGAAPGGWSQVAANRVKAADGRGAVVALDYLEFDAIPGVAILQQDFTDPTADERLIDVLAGRRPNAVLSDMAAPTTGHRQTDHLRIMGLAEEALAFAVRVMAPGGFFLSKVFQGGSEKAFLDILKRDFATVRHIKPKASRAESPELYVLATGFRGKPREQDGSEEEE